MMTKKTIDYSLCELWYGEKQTIEETLKSGVDFFIKKYNKKPKLIYVNKDVLNTSYDGIFLVKDKMLYAENLISMPTD